MVTNGQHINGTNNKIGGSSIGTSQNSSKQGGGQLKKRHTMINMNG